MVKGVNKSIIEISDTGSKYFSRVILFVAPEYVDKKSKKLSNEAEGIIRKIQMSTLSPSLREALANEKKRRFKFILFSSAAVLVTLTVLSFLLIF